MLIVVVMDKNYTLGIGENCILIENFKSALIGSETIQDVGIPFTLDQTKESVSAQKLGLRAQE